MRYKASQYNVFVECGDVTFVFNSKSGLRSLSFVENSRAAGVRNSLQNVFDEDAFSCAEIGTLSRKGFIVSNEEDELEEIRYRFNRLVNGSVLSLTVLPTRACNFRCKYCYESFEATKMDKGTCDSLIRFVSREIMHYSGLHVSWFGGEPLCALDVIEYLSDAFIQICRTGRKSYTANITTNGYLLDRETFKKLMDLHVVKYQVTLDGLKSDHDSNRVLCNGEGTFERVVKNICDIKNDFRSGRFSFVVRTNFSKKQIPRIAPYIGFLERLFDGDQRFSVFVRTVSYLGGGEEVLKKSEGSFTGFEDRKEIFRIVGDSISNLRLDVNFDMLSPGQSVCYAGINSHWVIDTDGTLRRCTCNLDDNENNSVGYLKPTGEPFIRYGVYNKWQGKFPEDEKCLKCRFLPVCIGTSCPATQVYGWEKGCPYEVLEIDSIVGAFVKTNMVKNLFEV